MPVGINASGLFKAIRVDSADTATGWAVTKLEGSGGSPSLLASVGTIDLVAEGTDARAARTNKQRVLIAFTDSAGYDFTSGSSGSGATKVPDGIAYVWAAFLAAGSILSKAAGGMQICLGDGINRSFWNVAGNDSGYTGGLIKWAAFTGIAPDETSGSPANLGNITEIGFVTDVGVAVTRFDNFVVDAIDVGDGLDINGTTDNDSLFVEAAAKDAETAINILKQDGGTVKAIGSIALSGSNLVSVSETLEFSDKVGGAYTYELMVTGTISLTNTAIQADGAVDYVLDTSGATAFSMVGGGLKKYSSLVTGAGQVVDGVVLQSGGAATINNTLTACPINQCGKITLNGSLSKCTVNKSTASEAVSGTNTNKVDACTFIKDTAASHAFELTGAGGPDAQNPVSYSWNCQATGYVAGNAGPNQEITGGAITGNETIHIPASSGYFKIDVADGATTPSVSTGGAVVEVASGSKTFSFDVNPSITGYEWRIYTVPAAGSLDGQVEIAGEETATVDNQSLAHSFSNQIVAVQVMASGYEEFLEFYTLTNTADQSITAKLDLDTNA